jgi:acetyl esterase
MSQVTETLYVDPETALLLREMEQAGMLPASSLSVTAARAQAEEGNRAWNQDPPALASVRELAMPGPAGPIRLRHYRPREASSLPLVIYFHGGGFVLGSLDTHNRVMRLLALDSDAAVIGVDYRLAPEHPFPAGPDDGVAVAAWLLEHGEAEFGSRRMLIGGESAGGYLSAAVALRIREELDAIDRVLGLELVFGVYDWGRSPSQRGVRPFAGPDLLDPDGIRFFTDCYLPGMSDEERRDPTVSPAFAGLAGMPPARFSVGTGDHLVDDTLWLSSRYAAAGNDVDLWVGPDLPHGFVWFPCELVKRWQVHREDWFTRILR